MTDADFEALLRRHEAFIKGANAEGPLIGYWVGGYCPTEQFGQGTGQWQEGQIIRPEEVRFEAFRSDYQRLYDLHDQVEDDFFYVGSAYWGIPWLEAIMGCEVRAGETSAWAKPCLAELDEAERIETDLADNAWFRCLKDFSRQLTEFSQGRFPVCAPLLRGVGDLAAAMRGTDAFVMDLVDCGQGAERLLEVCADVRVGVLGRLAEQAGEWRNSYAGGGYPSKVWSQRSVTYYQEDCAAYLSPALFREFLLPHARRMSEAGEVSFMHLHSGCLYPVEILLDDGRYDIIEINIDHEGAGPDLHDLMDVFRRVQQAGESLLLWGEMSNDEMAYLCEELDPAGLSLQPIWPQGD